MVVQTKIMNSTVPTQDLHIVVRGTHCDEKVRYQIKGCKFSHWYHTLNLHRQASIHITLHIMDSFQRVTLQLNSSRTDYSVPVSLMVLKNNHQRLFGRTKFKKLTTPRKQAWWEAALLCQEENSHLLFFPLKSDLDYFIRYFRRTDRIHCKTTQDAVFIGLVGHHSQVSSICSCSWSDWKQLKLTDI